MAYADVSRPIHIALAVTSKLLNFRLMALIFFGEQLGTNSAQHFQRYT